MLGLNHPQSKHIFAAARLLDAVLEKAKRAASAQASERLKLYSLCQQDIETMRWLNVNHFGNSAFVSTAIDELQGALVVLSKSASPQLNQIYSVLTKLDSDNGFGTVSI